MDAGLPPLGRESPTGCPPGGSASLCLDRRTLTIVEVGDAARALVAPTAVGRLPWEVVPGLDRVLLLEGATQDVVLAGRVLAARLAAGDGEHLHLVLQDPLAAFPLPLDPSGPQPLLVLSRSGRVLRVGGGAARLLGVPTRRLLDRHVAQVVGGDGHDALVRGVLEAADGGTATVGFRVTWSGRQRDVAVDLTGVGPAGDVVALLGVVRDVTARKVGERALETSEARYRKLAELSSEGIYRLRLVPLPAYEYVNPAFVALTGHPAERFYADPGIAARSLHPDDLARLEASRRQAAEGQHCLQVRWIRPDGAEVWLEVTEVPILDDRGEVVALQGVASDVTQRQQVQQALARALEQERRAADQLRRLHTMQAGFLQAVSHEVRTPLTNVVGFATTLRQHLDRLDDEQRDLVLLRMERNADRLQRLLADLLDVDRAVTGTSTAVRTTTDVGMLVRTVVEETGAMERIAVDAPHLVADVDRSKVERIVDNLVRNALKHTPAGTPIDVRLEAAPTGVTIAVADRGSGVPDDVKASIFEPFRQSPTHADPSSPGTGIGLALVQQFALLHGGRAWVEDREGGGARFCVHLPAPVGSESELDEREPLAG